MISEQQASKEILINTDDNFDYLDLDYIPDNLPDVFDGKDFSETESAMKSWIDVAIAPDYIGLLSKVVLNVELPPLQLTIIHTLMTKRFPILIGSRGMGKSFILAVYALIRMLTNPGCKIVIVGSAFRQSKQVFDYMVDIYNQSSVLQDIVGYSKKAGPRQDPDRCQFNLGNSRTYAIPLGDGTKIRGLRANYILCDETASINEEIFSVVVRGFGVVYSNPMERIKIEAIIANLRKQGKWTEQMQKAYQESMDANQIVFSGTAFLQANHFYEKYKRWKEIIYSRGNMDKLLDILDGDIASANTLDWKDYAILRIPHTEVPTGLLDEAMIANAKASMNNSQFNMEYGCVFANDTDGFYKWSVIDAATTHKPIKLAEDFEIMFHPKRFGDDEYNYIMGVDPASEQDNTAIVIIERQQYCRCIVYCWTIDRKRYKALQKQFGIHGDLALDYYRFIAQKIKHLCSMFNIERICIDKNGGGIAISESLSTKNSENDFPVYEIISKDESKPTDILDDGAHIVDLIKPTSDLNSDANHGMLKDLQSKNLLFPKFDNIEIERKIQLDIMNKDSQTQYFDSYEDVCVEIENLKKEIASIEVNPTSILGRETFDTPKIKGADHQKGRLRKDRYSALLYANHYARGNTKDTLIQYKAVGATKYTRHTSVSTENTGQMYYGRGTSRMQNKGNGFNPRYIKQK